ncbi:MAG: hypothetical protein N4A45_13785 [Flavobacteriales bacterium]|jgi:hypothetical protein|nr:hypothetical protein [Flavobacteriales bacterium]
MHYKLLLRLLCLMISQVYSQVGIETRNIHRTLDINKPCRIFSKMKLTGQSNNPILKLI